MPKAEALPCNINTLMRAKAVIIIARLTHVCLSNGCLNKCMLQLQYKLGYNHLKMAACAAEHRETRYRR